MLVIGLCILGGAFIGWASSQMNWPASTAVILALIWAAIVNWSFK